MDPDLRRLIPRGVGAGFPTRGGGTRYYVPDTAGLDIFRVSPGDANLDPAMVHSGPHVYVSRTGTCYPLHGNTASWPALPMSEEQFLDHVFLETLDDAVGLWELTAMAAATFPEMPMAERIRLVKSFVGTLLENRWVELFEKRPEDAQSVGWGVVPTNQQAAVMTTLTDDMDWDAEGIRSVVVRRFIMASDKGDAEFHRQLRQRGLYVDNRRRRWLRWPFS